MLLSTDKTTSCVVAPVTGNHRRIISVDCIVCRGDGHESTMTLTGRDIVQKDMIDLQEISRAK